MPKRHNDLFDDIASFPALRAAAKRAAKGKRRNAAAARFCPGWNATCCASNATCATTAGAPAPIR